MKSSGGKFESETPRDRAGTFEPKLVKKHQRTISDEIETKILSMYGLGMSFISLPMSQSIMPSMPPALCHWLEAQVASESWV